MKIFWSWQNDTPAKCNRHFVREALDEAVDALADEFGLDDADRPELDHDTKNVPGMAEIAATILDKIESCAVFVADLTPIASAASSKAVPNPNVLIELGWALHKPGWERIIAIMNTAGGWRVDHLPFDIRHRRALLYHLSETADHATRSAVKKQLVANLIGAIRTNVIEHAEAAAAATQITEVPAREGEPSIWASAGATFSHHDSLGRDCVTIVNLPAGPRGYIRVIPSGWRSSPPMVDDMARLQNDLAVWPQAEGTADGNFGATREGHVRYWTTGRTEDGRIESGNVAMYFDETGEFWVLHGTAIDESALRIDSLLGGWSQTLRRANGILDAHNACPVRRVEVGLTGITNVRWPGAHASDSHRARRPTFRLAKQLRNWTAANQLAFLNEAHAGLRNLFGLPKPAPDELRAILARWDSDRVKAPGSSD